MAGLTAANVQTAKALVTQSKSRYYRPSVRPAEGGQPRHAAWKERAKVHVLKRGDETALVAIVDLAVWLLHTCVKSGQMHVAKTLKKACS
jgi:hypothetical protein